MPLRALGQLAFTIAGFAVGGPLGGFIGSILGAAVFAPSLPGVEGPRADDLQITSSTAGKRIPYIAGRFITDGNIIWGLDIEEVATTRRVGRSLFSRGQRVTEFSYFATFAVSLCEGPIDGVLRVWAYGKPILDVRPASEVEVNLLNAFPDIQLGPFGPTQVISELQTQNQEFLERATIYLGTDDQSPDPLIEEHEGAGNVPAFRGQAYIVFNRLPLDQFGYGARIPQLRFEVCRPLPEIPEAPADTDNDGEDVPALLPDLDSPPEEIIPDDPNPDAPRMDDHVIIAEQNINFRFIIQTEFGGRPNGSIQLSAGGLFQTITVDGEDYPGNYDAALVLARWWGQPGSPNIDNENWEVRLTVLSGIEPVTNTSFTNQPGVWYPLDTPSPTNISAVYFQLAFSQPGSGVWRFEIRNVNTQEIVTSGDFDWTWPRP